MQCFSNSHTILTYLLTYSLINNCSVFDHIRSPWQCMLTELPRVWPCIVQIKKNMRNVLIASLSLCCVFMLRYIYVPTLYMYSRLIVSEGRFSYYWNSCSTLSTYTSICMLCSIKCVRHAVRVSINNALSACMDIPSIIDCVITSRLTKSSRGIVTAHGINISWSRNYATTQQLLKLRWRNLNYQVKQSI